MTLAISQQDQPWSTPVFYAFGGNNTFYWYSRKDTRHSQNIKVNNNVSASIFSTEGKDKYVGVYIEGAAEEVTEDELEYVIAIYAKKARIRHTEKARFSTKKDFLGDSPIRMYKLVSHKIYVSAPAKKWRDKWIDSKCEINVTVNK